MTREAEARTQKGTLAVLTEAGRVMAGPLGWGGGGGGPARHPLCQEEGDLIPPRAPLAWLSPGPCFSPGGAPPGSETSGVPAVRAQPPLRVFPRALGGGPTPWPVPTRAQAWHPNGGPRGCG